MRNYNEQELRKLIALKLLKNLNSSLNNFEENTDKLREYISKNLSFYYGNSYPYFETKGEVYIDYNNKLLREKYGNVLFMKNPYFINALLEDKRKIYDEIEDITEKLQVNYLENKFLNFALNNNENEIGKFQNLLKEYENKYIEMFRDDVDRNKILKKLNKLFENILQYLNIKKEDIFNQSFDKENLSELKKYENIFSFYMNDNNIVNKIQQINYEYKDKFNNKEDLKESLNNTNKIKNILNKKLNDLINKFKTDFNVWKKRLAKKKYKFNLNNLNKYSLNELKEIYKKLKYEEPNVNNQKELLNIIEKSIEEETLKLLKERGVYYYDIAALEILPENKEYLKILYNAVIVNPTSKISKDIINLFHVRSSFQLKESLRKLDLDFKIGEEKFGFGLTIIDEKLAEKMRLQEEKSDNKLILSIDELKNSDIVFENENSLKKFKEKNSNILKKHSNINLITLDKYKENVFDNLLTELKKLVKISGIDLNNSNDFEYLPRDIQHLLIKNTKKVEINNQETRKEKKEIKQKIKNSLGLG